MYACSSENPIFLTIFTEKKLQPKTASLHFTGKKTPVKANFFGEKKQTTKSTQNLQKPAFRR
jgi:hypothetical protein